MRFNDFKKSVKTEKCKRCKVVYVTNPESIKFHQEKQCSMYWRKYDKKKR